ncbi:MAG TPA: nucleotidyl transferase AbiEii/AbiGii toxin family protein [Polyangiaceae bacterium]|nr:nucleotidyl transferase AbiEii/AbiGii toxin family protein [Polyangiaceae bacterium]
MNRYANAAAFKQAVEARLRAAASSGHDFERRRQLLVFERFLARLTLELGDSMILKGGLVVELRVERARTTQDVDLRLTGSPTELLDRLHRAAELELGDFMIFTVTRDTEHPKITNEGMVYEGQRYRVVGALAGKPYGHPFGLDVAFADPIFGDPDVIETADTLAFAGIAPTRIPVYPLETHIAEKLHAYTIPRPRPNSRVKDLPDIALLAGVRGIAPTNLRAALDQTFLSRKTHPLPPSLPEPAASWAAPYARMAQQNELPWADLVTLTRAVQAFLDPVLSGTAAAAWVPATWRWGSGSADAVPSPASNEKTG